MASPGDQDPHQQKMLQDTIHKNDNVEEEQEDGQMHTIEQDFQNLMGSSSTATVDNQNNKVDDDDSDDFIMPSVQIDISDVLETFNNSPDRVQIDRLRNRYGTFTLGDRSVRSLYGWHPYTIPITYKHTRDLKTGEVTGYHVVDAVYEEQTGENSLLLTRSMGKDKKTESRAIKGDSTSFPFWPGGFDDQVVTKTRRLGGRDYSAEDLKEVSKRLFEDNLKTEPPFHIFPEGKLNVNIADGTIADDLVETTGESKAIVDDDGFKFVFKLPGEDLKQQQPDKKAIAALEKKKVDELDIDLKPKDSSIKVLGISKSTSNYKVNHLPWAVSVDVTRDVPAYKDIDPAITHKFELDNFQKQAVLLLEKHENVFVAAHTSAGKTVVAEYAIALSERHMTRTIYTSPIKALSNQKFRDFKTTFPSVGLVTGDMQIDTTASCIIMTTEILRSMLYNGSDMIRDLEWVIFDEIHYLNNEERGYVWEEVLIMLPKHVSIIMLSATVPNAMEFANWVGEIKRKIIYVISTPKRPVPLEHHLYTGSTGKSKGEQFCILNSEGRFLERGYDAAKEAKMAKMSKFQKSFGAKGGSAYAFNEASEKTIYLGLINHLKEMDKLPVVIFTFSRNRCDSYAGLLESVDLCSGKQKAEIHAFFHKSVGMLKGSDRQLPQILCLEAMLKNGIGVHHSGILPILKEVVEMLFQRGLVRILFATETFAMGVNMPARTVVFDSCRKHDGFAFRSLNSSEYIQMSGRAGRRGLDTTGTVIILCKQNLPDLNDLRVMLMGKAAKLKSQFRLTYSMILNLLRVERITVEDIMKRSFLEAARRTKSVKEITEQLATVESKLEEMNPQDVDHDLRDTYLDIKLFIEMKMKYSNYIFMHSNMTRILKEGRVVVVHDLPRFTPRLGVITSSRLTSQQGISTKTFNILIMLSIEEAKAKKSIIDENDADFYEYLYYASPWIVDRKPEIDDNQYNPYHTCIHVTGDKILDFIEITLDVKGNLVDQDVSIREKMGHGSPRQDTLNLLHNLQLITTDFYNGVITQTIGIHQVCVFKDAQAIQGVEVMRAFYEKSRKFSNCDPDSYRKLYDLFKKTYDYMKLADDKLKYEFLLSPQSLSLHDEYESRIDVLRKLNYISEENMVLLKGRVACEMGNQNELMVTELVMNNIVGECTPEETAALFSCFVFEAKNVPEPELNVDSVLYLKIKEIKETAKRIGQTQLDCGLKESVQQFVDQFKFGLVEVVLEWAQGKPFVDIMKLTDVQEGIIVRTIQRLEEILKDVKDAGMIIGDPAIKNKMEAASQAIKRDIVFAASLYVQD